MIRYEKEGGIYKPYIGKKCIGELLMTEDGFYNYFHINDFNNGFIPSWVMKELSRKLDTLNLELELQIAKDIGND